MGILRVTYKWARRCVIALLGGTVVLIGCAMLVLPGPAIVVIPAGLAILSLEFAWARHWLKKIRATGDYMMGSATAFWSRRWRKPLNESPQPQERKPYNEPRQPRNERQPYSGAAEHPSPKPSSPRRRGPSSE